MNVCTVVEMVCSRRVNAAKACLWVCVGSVCIFIGWKYLVRTLDISPSLRLTRIQLPHAS